MGQDIDVDVRPGENFSARDSRTEKSSISPLYILNKVTWRAAPMGYSRLSVSRKKNLNNFALHLYHTSNRAGALASNANLYLNRPSVRYPCVHVYMHPYTRIMYTRTFLDIEYSRKIAKGPTLYFHPARTPSVPAAGKVP